MRRFSARTRFGSIAALVSSILAIAPGGAGTAHASADAAIPDYNSSVAIRSFAGAWIAGATYKTGTVVTYGGSSYLCLVRNSGVAPNTNTGDWALLDSAGARGPRGATGPAGLQGSSGPQGAIGAAGPRGVPGPPGPAGAPGPKGAAGAPGPAGLPGPMGAAGLPGARGATGPAGPAGSPGSQGPQGPAGMTEAGDVPVIIDSTGKFVASAVYLNYMQIGSDFVSFGPLTQLGGPPATAFPTSDSSGLVFYHVAANCAGPRLILSYDALIGPLVIHNNNGYYPGGPLTAQTVQSVENFLDGEDVSQPSTHCSTTNLPISSLSVYGPVETVDMSTFGFVPPFYFALE